MAKIKFNTQEEALEAKQAAAEELAVAKEEFKNYRKENNLKKDYEPEDNKVGKGFKKAKEAVEKKAAALEEIKTALQAFKTTRESKYNYPEDCTSKEDQKKFRAKMRRQAKIDSGELKPRTPKEEKPSKEDKKADKKSDKKSDKKADKKADKKSDKKSDKED